MKNRHSCITTFQASTQDIESLFAPKTIRGRAQQILQLAKSGQTHFNYHDEKKSAVVDLVISTTQSRYPDLKIPFHSRWSHFKVGGRDRVSALQAKDKEEYCRMLLDLVITSVLLDAGAGMQWKYHEDGQNFSKSEGLAVASFHLFSSGALSSDSHHPLRADAEGLSRLSTAKLSHAFQVSQSNPLQGLEGRHSLLNRLGKTLEKHPELFQNRADKIFRPGHLWDYFHSQSLQMGGKISAVFILRTLQKGLGDIWPGRIILNQVNMGDLWHYPPLGEGLNALLPFHKLSQWLTYSMIEPLQDAGLLITDTEQLTGLAEYRNGGLFLDSGMITLKNKEELHQQHAVNSELVLEWRALTLALIEEIADPIRKKLGMNANNFPLGKILEGGTWAAGRILAQKARSDGGPPLKILSDGTVF